MESLRWRMFPVDGRVFGGVYGLVGLVAVIAIAILMPPT